MQPDPATHSLLALLIWPFPGIHGLVLRAGLNVEWLLLYSSILSGVELVPPLPLALSRRGSWLGVSESLLQLCSCVPRVQLAGTGACAVQTVLTF